MAIVEKNVQASDVSGELPIVKFMLQALRDYQSWGFMEAKMHRTYAYHRRETLEGGRHHA